MITDPQVVESTRATTPGGPWTFGRLFRDLSHTDAEAKDMLLAWLKSWETDQTANGDIAIARPSIRSVIIDPWKTRDGQAGTSDAEWAVNWDHAPFRLLAIVNRIDLRRETGGIPTDAGEGRFVFCLHDNKPGPRAGGFDNDGTPLPFTLIFEFQQRASSSAEVVAWARAWHELGSIPFGERYHEKLLEITNRFAARGRAPGSPTGSALNQLRTNEIQLRFPEWELREFVLVGNPARLSPTTVKQTPRNALDGQATLGQFINQHERQLISGELFVDPSGIGRGFLGMASLVPVGFVWDAPSVRDNDARHGLAFQACNGCHHRETGIDREFDPTRLVGSGFVHVAPRKKGEKARLSGFLTGTVAPDPISGKQRTFNDLESRARGADGMEVLLGIRTSGSETTLRASPTQNNRRFRVH